MSEELQELPADPIIDNELREKAHGKRVVFIFSSARDRYHTHRTNVAVFASRYARYGVQPRFLDLAGTDAKQIVSELGHPDVLGAHCEQSAGLEIRTQVTGSEASIFAVMGKPALAVIRDFPFYHWLRTECFGSHSHFILSFTDRSSMDLVKCVNSKVPAPPRVMFNPHVYFDLKPSEQRFEAADARDISLLYVGSYADPERRKAEFLNEYPEWAAPLSDLIDRARSDYFTPIWQHGKEAASDAGFEPDFVSAPFASFLQAANDIVRMTRRFELLERLAHHPLHLVWSGPRPDISLHPDTKLLEPTTFPETIDLIKRSRSIAMCLNSFPTALSERMLTAMFQNTAVICHTNALIAEYFCHEEDILLIEDTQSSLDHAVAKTHDTRKMNDLTAAARDKVMRNFSPGSVVADHLSALVDFEQTRDGGV